MINPVDTHALVGAPVFTPQGTQLGTIDSVRVDPGELDRGHGKTPSLVSARSQARGAL